MRSGGLLAAMAWSAEVARLARLARLDLAPEEAARLAAECAAIAASFCDLQARAASLPEPLAPAPGPLRADEPASAPEGEADAILAAAPRVDRRSRAVLAKRGEG